MYCGGAGVSPAEGLRFVVLVSNVNPTVYCGDAGISPAEGLRFVVLVSNVNPHFALWGRGRLARGGFSVCSSFVALSTPTVYCGDAGVSPAEDLRFVVMYAARQLHTANCTLQTILSVSRPSARVHKEHILPPLRGLFFVLSVPGVTLRSTPVCDLIAASRLKNFVDFVDFV